MLFFHSLWRERDEDRPPNGTGIHPSRPFCSAAPMSRVIGRRDLSFRKNGSSLGGPFLKLIISITLK